MGAAAPTTNPAEVPVAFGSGFVSVTDTVCAVADRVNPMVIGMGAVPTEGGRVTTAIDLVPLGRTGVATNGTVVAPTVRDAPVSSDPSSTLTWPPAYAAGASSRLSAWTPNEPVPPAVTALPGPETRNDLASPEITLMVGVSVVVKMPPPIPIMRNAIGPGVAEVVKRIDVRTDCPGRINEVRRGSVPKTTTSDEHEVTEPQGTTVCAQFPGPLTPADVIRPTPGGTTRVKAASDAPLVARFVTTKSALIAVEV